MPHADPATHPHAPTAAPVADPAPPAATPGLAARLEALLIATPRPLPPLRLAQALGLVPPDAPASPDAPPTPAADADPEVTIITPRKRRPRPATDALAQISAAVDDLNRHYTTTARAFRIETVAGGLRFMTLPAFGPDIAALHGSTAATRLSRSAMETLAIVAYRQPVTRATLESIRGVACGETLKTLMDRRLVTIAGRAEELGRPMLYATTRQFLELFGLASLKDLPATGELTPRT